MMDVLDFLQDREVLGEISLVQQATLMMEGGIMWPLFIMGQTKLFTWMAWRMQDT